MTSYEFEKIAKAEVAAELVGHGLAKECDISELEMVWFAHLLGFKKCTVWGPKMGNLYAEVTYNREKNELYVDFYEKLWNTSMKAPEV